MAAAIQQRKPKCSEVTSMAKIIYPAAYYVIKVDGVIVKVTENDSVALDYIVDYPGRVTVDPVGQGKFYGES